MQRSEGVGELKKKMPPLNQHSRIRSHYRDFFSGHPFEEHIWPLGPASVELPNLRDVEISPGPKSGLWVYATVGAWEANEPLLEFFIAAATPDLRHVELLFMAAWYHKSHRLGKFHTLPIGEPWVPDSTCDGFLVSLPYPFGPDLEICNLGDDRHMHVLWLLPITPKEREFKREHGVEALEEAFDSAAIEYWDPKRESVV